MRVRVYELEGEKFPNSFQLTFINYNYHYEQQHYISIYKQLVNSIVKNWIFRGDPFVKPLLNVFVFSEVLLRYAMSH